MPTPYISAADGDFAPENVTLTRMGDDLHLTLEGDSSPALILQGYFSLAEPAGLYGMAEDGQLYAYGRTDASGEIFSLADGEIKINNEKMELGEAAAVLQGMSN